MSQANTSAARRAVRTFLVLGRVSNLPTVFSNCIAGWWLGGHASTRHLPFLFAGATLLYLGGMYLNDAFDAEFDRQHRTGRPVPSGAIPLKTVWLIGWLLLILGWCCFLATGVVVAAWGLALVGCIVLYNAVHKRISWSPILMGLCRFFLYFAAAATGQGINNITALSAIALWAYVIGLSYLARRESTSGPFSWWPLLLLGAPVFLGLWVGYSAQREGSFLLAAVIGLWEARALRPLLFKAERNIGAVVSSLLAGIVLVDWLAIADAPRDFGFAFIALLFSALILQRFIPAT
jgi:hypothetical protein